MDLGQTTLNLRAILPFIEFVKVWIVYSQTAKAEALINATEGCDC